VFEAIIKVATYDENLPSDNLSIDIF